VINSITIENKSMVSLHGLKPGKQAVIEVDRDGTPLEQHWRRRLKDSITDGCITVIETPGEVAIENKSAKSTKKEAE
jgi:hypothetical protein